MILTETVKLRVNQNNYKYLLSKGFNNIKINDFIDINVNDLSKNSGHIINVKCDICGEEKTLQYRRYLKSYNNGGYYSCSNKCNIEKRKYKHTDKIKEKVKITCLDKYGVDSYSKTIEYKDRIKKTCLNKYGVENVFQLNDVKDKIKNTCLKKYGVDNPSKSNDIKIKKEKTCLINNNVKSPYQNKDIFNKSLKSGLKIKTYENSELYYQGSYEKDFLDRYYNKVIIKNGLSIKYQNNNSEKYYHTDFYLPDYDLIIEIKSTYWYNKCKELNIIKEQYAKKYHNYIIILDKNYDILEQIINHQSA
jgi:hypothetical protein